jgi:uncharacterized membrane protein HdeD (DUF308 family)
MQFVRPILLVVRISQRALSIDQNEVVCCNTRKSDQQVSEFLVQGVLMVLAGIVALVYPFVSTVALVVIRFPAGR